MAGLIPRNFIDDLLNRVDIVEVVDSRVPLKKKGREYWACCPFHGEKTASFSVSPTKQFYHCFGCQKSGNAVGFLMDYDHMEFVEAIEALAQMLGVDVPREEGSAPARAKPEGTDAMFEVMERCSQFYQTQLKQSDAAIEYLKNRGISGQTAKKFAIGYAPPGWNNLEGDKKWLVETGMQISKDDGNQYDRFRNRLMFPIRDRRGRTIAFGGRVIDPEDNPKYLNSPESPLFHKGQEIYGLHEMKKAVTNIDRIFITEGYMDVVALAEHGVETAVATLGTAINNRQIESLFRVCKNLVFCFDGDRAGRSAAWKSLEESLISLSEGRIARFMFMPDGHDPDTYVQEIGAEAFIEKAEKSTTFTDYLMDTLIKNTDISSREERDHFMDKLKPYLEQIPLQTMKNSMIAEAEKRVKIDIDPLTLKSLGAGQTNLGYKPPRPEQHWTPTKLAINLLLKKPALGANIGTLNELAESDIRGVDLLLRLLDQIHEEPSITTQNLLDRFQDDDHQKHLYTLAAMEPPVENDESLDRMFADCLQRLQKQYIHHRQKLLIAKLQSGEALSEAEKQEHRKLFAGKI